MGLGFAIQSFECFRAPFERLLPPQGQDPNYLRQACQCRPHPKLKTLIGDHPFFRQACQCRPLYRTVLTRLPRGEALFCVFKKLFVTLW